MNRVSLSKEGGVTRISLDNAKALIEAYGSPDKIKLFVREGWETYVEATWLPTAERPITIVHEFSGFSWGYGGEGPHGMFKFLEMLGLHVPVTMEQVAGWKDDDLPIMFTKGRDYGSLGRQRTYCPSCKNDVDDFVEEAGKCERCLETSAQRADRKRDERRDLYESGHPASDNFIVE